MIDTRSILIAAGMYRRGASVSAIARAVGVSSLDGWRLMFELEMRGVRRGPASSLYLTPSPRVRVVERRGGVRFRRVRYSVEEAA